MTMKLHINNHKLTTMKLQPETSVLEIHSNGDSLVYKGFVYKGVDLSFVHSREKLGII